MRSGMWTASMAAFAVCGALDNAAFAAGEAQVVWDAPPIRVSSVAGDPAAGDIVHYGGFVFTLDERGVEGLRTAAWSEGALVRDEPDGAEQIVAVYMSRWEEGKASVFDRLTPEQAAGLRGVRLETWNETIESRLVALNPEATVNLVSLGETFPRALGALPETSTRLILTGASGPLETLERFESLKALVILGDDERELTLRALENKRFLRVLQLFGMEVTAAASIGRAASLRSVELVAVSGVDDLGFVELLPELRMMRLTQTTASDLSVLDRSSAMEELYVLGNRVVRMPGRMPRLRLFEAYSSGVTAEQAAKFRELNPDCTLVTGWTDGVRGALASSTRVRVRSGGTCHRSEKEERTLFEIRDGAEVAALRESIEVDEDRSGVECMCCGEPTFEFFHGDEMIATIGFHHGQLLRWDGWPGDAVLTPASARALAATLKAHGVSGPATDVEEADSRRQAWAVRRGHYEDLFPDALEQALRDRNPNQEVGDVYRAQVGAGAQAAMFYFRLAGRHMTRWETKDPIEAFALEEGLDGLGPEALAEGMALAVDDEWGVRGLSRWLFGEFAWDKIGRESLESALDRAGTWGLAHPDPGARRLTIRSLMSLGGERAVGLLRRVVRGEIAARDSGELDLFEGNVTTLRGEEPGVSDAKRDSTAAAVALARLQDKQSAALIRGLLDDAPDEDRPLLQQSLRDLE